MTVKGLRSARLTILPTYLASIRHMIRTNAYHITTIVIHLNQ